MDIASDEYITVKGDNGNTYYFDNKNKGYLDAEVAGTHGSDDIVDSNGNVWTVIKGGDYSSASLGYYISAGISAA